jgi:hypothetical protein
MLSQIQSSWKVLFVCVGIAASHAAENIPSGYKLLYQQDFEKPGAIEDFVMTDPSAWKVTKDEKGGALELVSQSHYTPAFRSPFNIALIKGKEFGDFVMEADVIQTGKEYGHRDMCFFFGFDNPEHFYYAHIATAADDHAHNIFIVDNEPRTKIAKTTTKGAHWGLNLWHHVRIERELSDGMIKIYFDDMTLPIMMGESHAFEWGRIGFGSFDDTGKVDNIKIWGPSDRAPKEDVKFVNSPKTKN